MTSASGLRSCSGFPCWSRFLANWWWFKEIGYQIVFTRALTAWFLLFPAAGSLTAGVLYPPAW